MRNYRQHSVLILYNLPRETAVQRANPACLESEYGVLQEVSVVASALARLHIPFRIAGLRTLADLPATLGASPERIVFNLVEGFHLRPADACSVPAVCEAFDKAATGNDSACQFLALDKWRTNAVLREAGLRTPDGVLVPVGTAIPNHGLPRGAMIVKPVCADASEGIDAGSVLQGNGPALQRAVQRVHRRFGQGALIEPLIGRRELNVSVLQRGHSAEVVAIAEIDFSKFAADRPAIVDYSAKWMEESFEYQNTPRIIPANLSRRQAREVARMSLAAWQVLKCQDYARVDFRLDDRDRPVILEVNPNPDISPEGGFVAALKAADIRFEEFVRAVVRNARARLPGKHRRRLSDVHLPGEFTIRAIQHADREVILGMLNDTGFFRPDETAIAREVLDQSLAQGEQGHYQSFVVDEKGEAVGWVCFGQTPCTLETYEIYWIAVSARRQRAGFGRALLQHAEHLIRQRGGRICIVDTSGRPVYDATRQFYLRVGYKEIACLKDFYAPGDDKVIYSKMLL